MKQNTLYNLTVYCMGDSDYRGTVIREAMSKTEAVKALRDYVYCHSTKTYPLKKDGSMGYCNKFMRVYLEEWQSSYNGSYIALPKEDEFTLMTDEIIIRVVGYDVNIVVDSIEDGIKTIKSLQREGMMARVKVEKLFYVKRAYAFNRDGNLLLQYFPIWREVPIH